MRDVIKEPFGTKHKVEDLGIEHGLTVLMDPFLDDYFFPILPVKGWKASKSGIKCHLEKPIVEKTKHRPLIFHIRQNDFISELKLNLPSR